MNVLYMFGNGLDKAQGMKTSYPEFYEYLQAVKGSPLLEELKKDINADKKLWSDMEEAFGLFTEKIKSESDFDQLYFELYDHLRSYLQDQELNYRPSSKNKEKFINNFKKALDETFKQFIIIGATVLKEMFNIKREQNTIKFLADMF